MLTACFSERLPTLKEAEEALSEALITEALCRADGNQVRRIPWPWPRPPASSPSRGPEGMFPCARGLPPRSLSPVPGQTRQPPTRGSTGRRLAGPAPGLFRPLADSQSAAGAAVTGERSECSGVSAANADP